VENESVSGPESEQRHANQKRFVLKISGTSPTLFDGGKSVKIREQDQQIIENRKQVFVEDEKKGQRKKKKRG